MMYVNKPDEAFLALGLDEQANALRLLTTRSIMSAEVTVEASRLLMLKASDAIARAQRTLHGTFEVPHAL